MVTTYNKDRIANLLDRSPFGMSSILGIVEVGSTVYLGRRQDTDDDLDLLAVALEGPSEVIMRQPKSHSIRTQPDGVRSRMGDIDLVVHPLRKFASLLAGGNPSLLTAVFSPVIHYDNGWSRVQALHGRTASNRALDAFRGYMRQQIERWTGERGQKKVNRPELIEAYGFDTKYAYHAIRLGLQGIEYAQTGRFTLPIPEPVASSLISLRTGGFTESEALEWARDVESELLSVESVLPQRSNRVGLDADVARIYLDYWT